MYFWKINKLKSELKENSLSESESFKYLFATTLLYSLGMTPYIDSTVWDVYAALVGSIITIIGLFYVYKCNGGAKGKNFLQRYLALNWVVGLRWTVLVAMPITIVFMILIGALATFLEVPIPDDWTLVSDDVSLYSIVFFSLLYPSYFWLLGKHIKSLGDHKSV